MPTNYLARMKAVAYHRAAKRFFRLQAEQEQHLHPDVPWKDRGQAMYRQWEATQPPIPPIDWAEVMRERERLDRASETIRGLIRGL